MSRYALQPLPAVLREYGLDGGVSPSCPLETRRRDAELTIRNAVAAAYFEQNFLKAVTTKFTGRFAVLVSF